MSKSGKKEGPRAPAPKDSVLVVGPNGKKELEAPDITPESVGWKGFGLAVIPRKWSLPFFVIDAECAGDSQHLSPESLQIYAGLAGLNIEAPLLIRSSGTHETLAERGRLESAQCNKNRIRETIEQLRKQIPSQYTGRIHWIVQEHRRPRSKGHFSNERRVSYEKRDWVLEIEPRDGYPASSSSVAVRHWRDGYDYDSGELACNSEARISVCLKQVAMWAHQFSQRLHFEWVWDGDRVFVVQLDREEGITGVHPQSLLPKTIHLIDINSLSVFRIAADDDFTALRKLKNAQLYQSLGYKMPPFYVLRDPDSIRALVFDGVITQDVQHDLKTLTERPLIIRTDGVDIPDGKREMLPRSDELRSLEDATRWLLGSFRQKITDNDIASKSLVLIAHHFIPSLASVWARAEPGRPFVRIEALWGIPEGLYWFSHDTFEVDTQSPEISAARYSDVLLPAQRRRRHKETFVAPNEDGQWVRTRQRPRRIGASRLLTTDGYRKLRGQPS